MLICSHTLKDIQTLTPMHVYTYIDTHSPCPHTHVLAQVYVHIPHTCVYKHTRRAYLYIVYKHACIKMLVHIHTSHTQIYSHMYTYTYIYAHTNIHIQDIVTP